MSDDRELPNIKAGRGGERSLEKPGEVETATVEYLSYGVLERNGWSRDDEDLFEKAAAADLDESHYGVIEVPRNEYLLDAAENAGLSWPFECRAASCANCCAYLIEGELEMDMDLFLTDEEVEEMNIRLTCVAKPTSDELKVVYEARRSEYLQNVVGQREV
ncbi:Ferredoxin [Halogranum amylolyticum]|uniref:Ferredoxin n=1 Tax=Halogranum amylolyticum TaxID=660520 RepID=A0A1H8TI75_9EURY|nr:ferredoxin Fer [Halogranum amylolyticum]SEO90790.1 Ferredoxin [Halogranum amylolyticum]